MSSISRGTRLALAVPLLVGLGIVVWLITRQTGGLDVRNRIDVVRVAIVPIPEGITAPVFSRDARAGEKQLALVFDAIPDPLPAVIPQTCSVGVNIEIFFADGTVVTYGPCRRPASIERLREAILRVR